MNFQMNQIESDVHSKEDVGYKLVIFRVLWRRNASSPKGVEDDILLVAAQNESYISRIIEVAPQQNEINTASP